MILEIVEVVIGSVAIGFSTHAIGRARGWNAGWCAGIESVTPDIAAARVAGEAEGAERGRAEGWANCRAAVKDQLAAAETVAKTALASANAARAATVSHTDMIELLRENRGLGLALKEGYADVAARVDLMDTDLRAIYSGFEQANIIRRRNDPNAGRQHGEPISERPVPLPPPGEPRQN